MMIGYAKKYPNKSIAFECSSAHAQELSGPWWVYWQNIPSFKADGGILQALMVWNWPSFKYGGSLQDTFKILCS